MKQPEILSVKDYIKQNYLLIQQRTLYGNTKKAIAESYIECLMINGLISEYIKLGINPEDADWYSTAELIFILQTNTENILTKIQESELFVLENTYNETSDSLRYLKETDFSNSNITCTIRYIIEDKEKYANYLKEQIISIKTRKGQYLTAIDVWKIEDGRNALIRGKQYQILESNPNTIVIRSEVHEEHIFKIQDLNKYFFIY